MGVDTCVVVSFYDERPSDELVRLLRQLLDTDEGGEIKVCVVVNSERHFQISLPEDLSGMTVIYRKNSGFNIGAWNHGWKENPGFSYYIFLQDECEIVNARWLSRYKLLLSRNRAGLVGESLLLWPSWASLSREWPESYAECVSLGNLQNIELGTSSSHLQTLALGATAACLEATGGFLMADNKAGAIATEIMFSRHCICLGFKISQSAWRPFEFFSHSQWSEIRNTSNKLAWNISRALKLMRRR